MTAPARCPGCGTALKPDWENCPNCPLSFVTQEAPSDSPLRGGGTRDFVIPALFLIGLGSGVYFLGQTVADMVKEQTKVEEPPKDQVLPASIPDKEQVEVLLQQAKTLMADPSPVMNADGTLSTALPPSAAAPAPAPAPPAAPEPAEEEGDGITAISIVGGSGRTGRSSRRSNEWRVRGGVYDLLTFAPLSGATLTFSDVRGNRKVRSVSNSKGQYRVLLPPLREGGYAVTLVKHGYAASALNPGARPREMDEETRADLARDLRSTFAPPDVLEPSAERPLEADFYLAPLEK